MKKIILMLFLILNHNLAFSEDSNLLGKLKKSKELMDKSIKKQDQAINYAQKISKKKSINISDSSKLCSMIDEVYDLRQEAIGYIDSIDLPPEQLEAISSINSAKSSMNNLLQDAANAKVSSGCQQLKEQQAGIEAAEKWVQFNKSLGCEELWKIKQDCAVAGDIKECIRIKKQGRSFIGC